MAKNPSLYNRENIAIPCDEISERRKSDIVWNEKHNRKRYKIETINEQFINIADCIAKLSASTNCEFNTILSVVEDNANDLCGILILREQLELISQEIKEKTINLNLAY